MPSHVKTGIYLLKHEQFPGNDARLLSETKVPHVRFMVDAVVLVISRNLHPELCVYAMTSVLRPAIHISGFSFTDAGLASSRATVKIVMFGP